MLLAAWLTASTMPAEETPDAKAILEDLRFAQAKINQELTGRLRTEAGVKVPFRLRLQGQQIAFIFSDPAETLQLQLNDEGSTLVQTTETGERKIGGTKFTQQVRDTDITYEDLSLRFLYWDKARVEGEARVKNFSCWIVLTQPSVRNTDYGSVRLWISKEGSGLLRAEAFNWQGQLVKRFEVISGQKVESKWILKQMRIERFDPGSKRAVSRTYMEVDG
jgi:hypothetical protein